MTAGGPVRERHPPPAGPGVVPPFVAPPTDGARQRRWLAVGLGGGAALLCCVGALFGLGGLVVLGSQALLDEGRAAVQDYLAAVQVGNYAQAYLLLCDAKQNTTGLPEFERSFAGPDLVSFSVGQAELTEPITVAATLRFDGGGSDVVRFLLEQDSTTGELEVCGQTE